jgi:hypothetical protein
MRFSDYVQADYAPVDNWQAILDGDDPQPLGPHGVILHCRQLSVRETPIPLGERRAMEMEAAGNAIAESTAYTARAARITFAEGKDLLILEGDGRNDAVLFRQLQVGGSTSPVAARKIYYNVKTGTVSGAIRSLDLNPLPTGKGGKP